MLNKSARNYEHFGAAEYGDPKRGEAQRLVLQWTMDWCSLQNYPKYTPPKQFDSDVVQVISRGFSENL